MNHLYHGGGGGGGGMFVVAPVRQSAVFDECVGQEFVEL